MPDPSQIDVNEVHDAPDMITAPETSDRSGTQTQPTERPYLRVFGPDIGVFDYELGEQSVSVGRADDADIRLLHPRVSRAHAEITWQNGQHTVEDLNSSHGTLVNRSKITRHELRHGDSIQIGLYLMQFRTHPALPGAAAAAARAKLLLRAEFCLLPSTMRLKFRVLQVAAKELFSTGDTLRIGHGGLLVPTESALDVATCTELHLSWPSGVSKRYLGEIIGAIPGESIHWTCVKLHTVAKAVHEATVERGQPGPWIDVLAT